jgi:hypothetical protein
MGTRRWQLVIGAAVFLLAAALALLQVVDFFQADACLDGGGSYDYSAGACDHENSHAFIAFYQTWTFWLSIVLGIVGSYLISLGSGNEDARLPADEA